MPFTQEDDIDYYSNPFAKCPHCDHEDRDSFEIREGESIQNCGSCGEEYRVTVNVEVTYDTEPVDVDTYLAKLEKAHEDARDQATWGESGAKLERAERLMDERKGN